MGGMLVFSPVVTQANLDGEFKNNTAPVLLDGRIIFKVNSSVELSAKERADIIEIIREHVDLKRSGFRYLGSCPFHQEKTPSFTVHPDQQFYLCFGC